MSIFYLTPKCSDFKLNCWGVGKGGIFYWSENRSGIKALRCNKWI